MHPAPYVVFVEDPGAVNCIAPLVEELVASGSRCVLLSAGLGTQLLRSRGLSPTELTRTEDALAAMARVQADWLIVGTSENPDSYAFAMIEAARQRHIRSAALVDFAANAAHRFRGRSLDPLAHAPDYVLVPDEWTAAEFRALGIPAARVAVVGHAHYDYLEEVRVRLHAKGRDAVRSATVPGSARVRRTIVVFASEISTGLDPAQYRRSESYTLRGRGSADGRTEIVVEEFLDAIAALEADGITRPYLILRQHPKEGAENLAAYRRSFDDVSSGGDPLPLLFAADLIVGMSSMLLVEAHMLGTPVISLLPRVEERSWCPITRNSTVPCATDRDEFRGFLQRALIQAERSARESAVFAQRQAGRSVQRAFEFLRSAPLRRTFNSGPAP